MTTSLDTDTTPWVERFVMMSPADLTLSPRNFAALLHLRRSAGLSKDNPRRIRGRQEVFVLHDRLVASLGCKPETLRRRLTGGPLVKRELVREADVKWWAPTPADGKPREESRLHVSVAVTEVVTAKGTQHVQVPWPWVWSEEGETSDVWVPTGVPDEAVWMAAALRLVAGGHEVTRVSIKWLSTSPLSPVVGTSVRTLEYRMRLAEAAGLVTVTQETRAGGRRGAERTVHTVPVSATTVAQRTIPRRSAVKPEGVADTANPKRAGDVDAIVTEVEPVAASASWRDVDPFAVPGVEPVCMAG